MYVSISSIKDICALSSRLLGLAFILQLKHLSAAGYDFVIYIYMCFNIHRYIYVLYIDKYNLLDYYIIYSTGLKIELSLYHKLHYGDKVWIKSFLLKQNLKLSIFLSVQSTFK